MSKILLWQTPEFRATVVRAPEQLVIYGRPPLIDLEVLLGPAPLTLSEVLGGVLLVGLYLVSAASVVALLWWLAKLI